MRKCFQLLAHPALRPNKVEVVSIEGTGAMSMSESKDGAGGVDVGLVSEKNSMQVFAILLAEGLANPMC
ncbi:unnamed protein product [Prunus armeniaca]|uniref:Uncharacterized protein n=1 Tax=Prunus armeniaca TaxID=36596 RepID=A0A6J5UF37_PRUAR|nr:unnamed protein product [Prunus armeniaca]